MNKEVLVALIAKDVNELQTLTEGLDQMETIPAPYLRLALDKSKALTTNLDNLINYLNNKELEDAAEAQRQAELEAARAEEEARKAEEEARRVEEEARRAEEEARQAELARIAEEQEALLRAQELERERQAEERRKAEAEIARQVAALEAARQLELEEKSRVCNEQNEAENKITMETSEEKSIASTENIDSIAPTAPVETTAPTTSIVGAIAENQPQTLAESIETSESLADKLAKTADDTLAEVINNKKIIDLKSSITLGDRFRFQRELFGGNGEKMNKAISDFNSFETMTEAQSYIAKNFDWPLDNDAVSDFIQLLQRRYL
ncbi:MAG: hypothetical protein IJY67_09555 [Paludibacteraceae bacterium]|nr:hypothetical protein [Paludibacteraceae bacterium]